MVEKIYYIIVRLQKHENFSLPHVDGLKDSEFNIDANSALFDNGWPAMNACLEHYCAGADCGENNAGSNVRMYNSSGPGYVLPLVRLHMP